VCHEFINDSRFYLFQLQIDEEIAAEVQEKNCPYCGGVLHSARYPRKPRGLREHFPEAYAIRLSFCCAQEDCRRRTTPPSVRFLGRKVYVGIMVILITALNHGLSNKRRHQLMEQLNLSPQTFYRWRAWWREHFVESRCWKMQRGYFIPPLASTQLPGALLGRLSGQHLLHRLWQLLHLLLPITTVSHSGYLKVAINPQKM
jgi:hypothetical protein